MEIKFRKFKEYCRYRDRCYCDWRNNSWYWLAKIKGNTPCSYMDFCKKRTCPVFNKEGYLIYNK